MEAILDEICLCGLEGCTIDELWYHLELHHPPFLLSLATSTAKEYIWRQILQLTRHVTLYKTPRPKAIPEPTTKHELVGMNMQWVEYIPSDKYTPITNGEVNGSCSSYNDRVDVTSEILNLTPLKRTLDRINEKYGERCIVLVGSPSCRKRSLIPSHIDPSLSLSPIKYCILEVIGQSRYHGMYRSNLTNKYMNIDPRSTFHFVKVLAQFGLINIKVLLLRPNEGKPAQSVHVIFLKRFTPSFNDNMHQEQSKEQLMCNLLLSSPNHTLPMTDIREQMGASAYKKAHATLVRNGVIESVTFSEEGSPLKMIKLIKPLTTEHDTITEHDSEDEETTGEGTVSPVVELPLIMQGYRLIDGCGPTGITMTDFTRNSFKLNPYLCRSIANTLVKQSYVTSYLSDSNKIRVLNLITKRHVGSNKDITQLNAELAQHATTQTTPTTIATPIRTGINLHSLKRPHPSDKRSHPSSSDKRQKLIDTEGEESLIEEKVETDQQIITYKQIKRINLLSNFVKEERIFEGHVILNKFLSEKEKRKVDRKTIKRFVDKLIEANRMCSREVTVGDRRVIIYYHPTVTDTELNDYITNKLMKLNFPQKQQSPKVIKREKKQPKSEGKHSVTKSFLSTSKFQRIKHLHFYIWILSNRPESREYSKETDSESKKSGNLWHESFAVLLPESVFPWLPGVAQLPVLTEDNISFNDIVFYMPLSLLLILSNSLSIDKVNRDVLYDSNYSCVPLHSLPHRIQLIINMRKEQSTLIELLKAMQEMKLVTINGAVKDRSNVTVTLNYNLTIMDTSCTKPRHSFFTNEARSLFTLSHHTITSLTQLQQYWYTLQHTCINTPIKIGRRKNRSTTAINDEYSLTHTKGIRDYTYLNTLGFGAGGLPPSTFSHLSKNWSIIRSLKLQSTSSIGMSPSGTVMGGSVPAHSGGKGLARHRVKKALKNAHKVQLKLKEKSKVASCLTSLLKGGMSAEDMIALNSRTTDRTVWFPHEDNFLLMEYIATLVLHRLDHPPTPQHVLRDALHSKFKSSRDKTVPALHRRLKRLLKTYTLTNLNKCVTEIIEEMGKLNETGPEQTFHSLLQFISQRYISHDGHVINISVQTSDVLLPSALEGLDKSNDKESVVDKFDKLNENQRIVLNIILFSAGPDSSLVDSYTVYKLLEQHTEEDIIAAMECLKSQSLIVHKKSSVRKEVSIDSKRLVLGSSFHQLFDGIYNKELFTDILQQPLAVIDTSTVTGGTVAWFINHSFNIAKPLEYHSEPMFPSPLMVTEGQGGVVNPLIQSLINESNDKGNDIASLAAKAGIASLLQIDESYVLQHGTITLTYPNTTTGMDPLQENTSINIQEDMSLLAPSTISVTSFDSFLNYATSSLNYSPIAIATTLHLYSVIDSSQREGVTMAKITNTCNEDCSTIIQDLLNFKLVYKVGTTIPLFVSHTHHHKWFYDVNGEELSMCHPWMQQEGEGSIIINELSRGVLMYIIARPGITMVDLYSHFKYILQYTSLLAILEVLIAANCLIKYTLHNPIRHSPFADHTPSIIKSCHDNDPPTLICYEATVWSESVWARQIDNNT